MMDLLRNKFNKYKHKTTPQLKAMSSLSNQNQLMNYCPCCTDKLLRHLNRNSIYWFCPQCRQTMAVVRSDTVKTYQDNF